MKLNSAYIVGDSLNIPSVLPSHFTYQIFSTVDEFCTFLPTCSDISPVIFFNMALSDYNYREILSTIKDDRPLSFIICYNGPADVALAIDVIKSGAYDYLIFPYTAAQIREKLGDISHMQKSIIATDATTVKTLKTPFQAQQIKEPDNAKPKVLFIEDEVLLRDHITYYLGNSYDVVVASSGAEGLALFEAWPHYPVVIIDLHLPDMNGLELISPFKEMNKRAQIIAITAYDDIRCAIKAVQMGAFDYMSKPFQRSDLISSISEALQINNQNLTALPSSGAKFTTTYKLSLLKQLLQQRRSSKEEVIMRDIYLYFPELRKTNILETTTIPQPILAAGLSEFITDLETVVKSQAV